MFELRLLVAGSRSFNDYSLLSKELHTFANSSDIPVSIVSGMAKGADRLAYEFAINNSVKCYEFPANWALHGRGAGMIRNIEMANNSDALLAFWDGSSRGTKHMIQQMKNRRKPVKVIHY